MKTPNAINSAVGALKLVPMYLNHPTVISRATLIGAVISDGQVAYVTPVKCPEYPYGAVIADAKGNVLAAAKGKSKEGLAELIRLKLVPRKEGYGEESA